MKFNILLLLCSVIVTAQETVIPATMLSKNIKNEERYMGSDAFGWNYTLVNNEFRKEKEGKVLKYKALSLGSVYRADLQNPLQIVLFYKKFNTAVLLDNQLNETARIDFSDLLTANTTQPIIAEAVGLASQNRLWVYDINTQKIGLYSLAQKSFKLLTPPFNESVQYYQNDYNYFYWIDAKNDCYAVNLFGKVNYLGHLPDFEQIQLLPSGKAILKQNDTLYLYTMEPKSLTNIKITEKTFEGFYYAAQILTIFTGNEIIQYKITLPE